MDSNFEELKQIMASLTEDKTVIAEAILDFVQNQPDKNVASLVEFLFVNFNLVEQNTLKLQNSGLSENLWRRLVPTIGPEIERNLAVIVQPKFNTKNICQQLWSMINRYNSQEEKIIALARVLFDREYFPLLSDEERQGALTISENLFRETMEKLDKILREIFKIKSNLDFNSWIEIASTLLYQLAQVDRPEERVVLMTTILVPLSRQEHFGRHFPGTVNLSDEVIQSYQQEYSLKAKTLFKIFSTNFFDQKTERAGALLHFIQHAADQNLQILMLSQILRITHEKIQEQIEQEVILPALIKSIIIDKLINSQNQSPAFDCKLGLEVKQENCLRCDKLDCPHHPINGPAPKV